MAACGVVLLREGQGRLARARAKQAGDPFLHFGVIVSRLGRRCRQHAYSQHLASGLIKLLDLLQA